MTTLAARPVEDPDQLDLFADPYTSLHKPFADAFREACRAEAESNDGWVDPNKVRARLLDHPSYAPRQLSALWCSSCGRSGFMVTDRDVRVPISGEGSRGNSNKDVAMRRWVGESA